MLLKPEISAGLMGLLARKQWLTYYIYQRKLKRFNVLRQRTEASYITTASTNVDWSVHLAESLWRLWYFGGVELYLVSFNSMFQFACLPKRSKTKSYHCGIIIWVAGPGGGYHPYQLFNGVHFSCSIETASRSRIVFKMIPLSALLFIRHVFKLMCLHSIYQSIIYLSMQVNTLQYARTTGASYITTVQVGWSIHWKRKTLLECFIRVLEKP